MSVSKNFETYQTLILVIKVWMESIQSATYIFNTV